MMKSIVTRLIALSLCSLGAVILLGYEFSEGALSPRALGLILLILCSVIVIMVAFIIRRKPNSPSAIPESLGTPIDAAGQKQLLWRIRMAKLRIIIMILALVWGLTQMRNLPLFPLLLGAIVNLVVTGMSIRTIVLLQKTIR